MSGLKLSEPVITLEEVSVLLHLCEERLCEPVEYGRELAPRTEEVLESIVTKLRHYERGAVPH